MPRIDKLQRQFPTVDLRFQLISGALRGAVENVDLGMRFRDRDEAGGGGTLVMKEVMVPICSPAYLTADDGEQSEGNTIIKLADTPGDWAQDYPRFLTRRSGLTKMLSFTDYAVVMQAALLGQGIALGWLTVASHWLLTGALVPAADTLTTTRRVCEFLPPRNRSMRPVAAEIKDWIIEQMKREVSQIDRLYPHLGLMTACY
jgi:DNA-binding transcriptional LysR family regulator